MVEVQSPNSYLVELDDGSRRIIHANHLRMFHVKTQSVKYDSQLLTHDYDKCGVNSCALINDNDTDFGEIHAFESADDQNTPKLPSQLIDHSTLAHLSMEQQSKLLQLLDKYAAVFRIPLV